MPFETKPLDAGTGALERYSKALPKALVTAALDKADEREGRTTAILVYGFVYTHGPSGAVIDVPEGFITDFASIPEAVRFAFPPFGRHAKAAVLHDWLYAIGEPGRKAFADKIFLDAMTELGVEASARRTMYEAVNLFGGRGFNRAAEDWGSSWGDWRTGDRTPAPAARETFFEANWKTKPAPNYDPD